MNKQSLLILFFSLFLSPLLAQESLNTNQQVDFEKEAMKRVEQLGFYISKIADKRSDDETKDLATDQALKLFYDPANNVIQVSSVHNTSTVNRKVTEYLDRLRNLPYSNVKIDWFEAFYVSNLRKGVDGKYYATISVGQKFDAKNNDGSWQIGDVVYKNLVVVLEALESSTGEVDWLVYLGDIFVTDQTQ